MIIADGQNVYHGMRNIGVDISGINWNRVFEDLAGEFELVGVQWHRPGSIEPLRFSQEGVLSRLLEDKYPDKQSEYLSLYRQKLLPASVYQEMKGIYKRKIAWLKGAKQQFSEIDQYYQTLADTISYFHLKRSGVLKVDLYTCKYVEEKGTDVAVASEMVRAACKQVCDKIILISGDMDFVHAVKLVQEEGKKLEVVQFFHENKKTPISAALLGQACERKIINIQQYYDLKDCKDGFAKSQMFYYRVMKKKVQRAVGKSVFAKAKSELGTYLRYYPDTDAEKEVIMLAARESAIGRDATKGVISPEQAWVGHQRVLQSVLELVDRIRPE